MRYELFLLLILLTACGKDVEVTPTPEYTGIKVSEALTNENQEVIHNIYNFDKIAKNVTITTYCYGLNGETIDTSDTFNMILEPESVSGWRPKCPENTQNYRIDIEEKE